MLSLKQSEAFLRYDPIDTKVVKVNAWICSAFRKLPSCQTTTSLRTLSIWWLTGKSDKEAVPCHHDTSPYDVEIISTYQDWYLIMSILHIISLYQSWYLITLSCLHHIIISGLAPYYLILSTSYHYNGASTLSLYHFDIISLYRG